jgi:Domain of unknown function (DUF4149)
VLRDHAGALHLKRNALSERCGTVVLTLWVGSLWTIGYLVAPALFATLADRAQAGRLAGILFGIEYDLTLACAPLYVLCELASGRRGAWLAAPAMMLCMAAVTELVLRPRIAVAVPGSAAFAWLHGTAAGLYMLSSLTGLILVWRRQRPAAA